MIDAIKTFFVDILGAEGGVFICSMIPIIELRGSIPLGYALGLPWWQSFLISIVGNMLPVPFILLFINRFIKWSANSKIKFLNKFAGWLLKKVEKNRAKIEKYGIWGVARFVAIPLPGTGAWTGSLVAAVIDMKFWKSVLSATIGVLAAGIVITLVCYGGIDAVIKLFA